MLTILIVLFLIGYLCIALEHPLKINKAASALITAAAAWIVYMLIAPETVPGTSGFGFFWRKIRRWPACRCISRRYIMCSRCRSSRAWARSPRFCSS